MSWRILLEGSTVVQWIGVGTELELEGLEKEFFFSVLWQAVHTLVNDGVGDEGSSSIMKHQTCDMMW
jgi:hypothetical protein